jgi:hypothetical protein
MNAIINVLDKERNTQLYVSIINAGGLSHRVKIRFRVGKLCPECPVDGRICFISLPRIPCAYLGLYSSY